MSYTEWSPKVDLNLASRSLNTYWWTQLVDFVSLEKYLPVNRICSFVRC